jgi:PAS domain S-box-containing protein
VSVSDSIDPNVFRAILEHLNMAVDVVGRDGRIAFWNDGAERITGYFRQDVIGWICGETLLGDIEEDEALGFVPSALAASREPRPLHAQISLRRKSGHRVVVQLWTFPIRNAQGVLAGTAETFNEIIDLAEWDRRQSKLAVYGCIDLARGVLTHGVMAPTEQPIIVIKKKGGHGAHRGGAWKVAYADFVTAMMSLFIVLWLMNTSQKIREAVGGYFKDPSGTAKLAGSNMQGVAENFVVTKDNMEELKEQLEKTIGEVPDFDRLKNHIDMTVTNEGLRIELTESATGTFFDSGSTKISADGADLLIALAHELGKLPNKLAGGAEAPEGKNTGTAESKAEAVTKKSRENPKKE